MARMTATEAAVKVLESEGVEAIFGIPGANINAFYAALAKSEQIRHFIARHEEGASHAADGYARASGKVGVCTGTSGPAGTNFITGLYTAQADSIPIIAITGQHVRAMQGKEGFQAVDVHEIARPVCKKTYYVRDSGQVPWVLHEAFKIAQEGRPGPVLVDLPIDVQQGEIEWDPAVDAPLPIQKIGPDLRRVRRALDLVLAAERPILLLGGGVILAQAADEARQVAEHLQLPVVTTGMAKGVLAFDHPLYAGEVGIQGMTRAGNAYFLDSDLVLAVGCRFADRHTGALDVYTRGRTFIHVDVDPYQLNRIVMAELGIVSDARLFLATLLEIAQARVAPREPDLRARRVPEWRERFKRKLDYEQTPIKPHRIFKEINEFFDSDTIFVTCIGLNQIWASQFQEISKPGHFIYCGGAGPLGWDLPAAIGVKLAQPDHLVVNVTGDYGITFCGEELAMAVQYRIPILVIIVNNGNMSLIRQNQKYVYRVNYAIDLAYDGQQLDMGGDRVGGVSSSAERGPLIDFVQWARAFGAWAVRVDDPAHISGAFQRALDEALAHGKPAVIDVKVEYGADAAMGTALDAIREFEPADSAVEVPPPSVPEMVREPTTADVR